MVNLAKVATKKAPQKEKTPPPPRVKEGSMEEDINKAPLAKAIAKNSEAVNNKTSEGKQPSVADDSVESYEDSEKEGASSENDDDCGDDGLEDEKAPVTPAKRKADTKKDKETPPAKKEKSDEGFILFMGNVNSGEDSGEIESAIAHFFSNEGLEIKDVRLAASRKFGYVDFASEEDLQKALELNGKKLMGQPVKLDRARMKENSKPASDLTNKLLVNNLPFSATEDTLRHMFTKAVSFRMPQKNGKSLGYGYVEFESVKDASNAMKTCKNIEIDGRNVRVEYSYTGQEREGRGKGGVGCSSNRVFINNMSFIVTEDSVRQVFEKAVAIRIPLDKGQAQKYALLEFNSVKEATQTRTTCHKMRIESQSIKLESGNETRSSGKERGSSEPTKTLGVKGLSENTTGQTLKDVFEGSVSARIITDRDTGSSKGFGFVEFNSEEDCKAAREAMEDCEIHGKTVTLYYANAKQVASRGEGKGGSVGSAGGRGGGSRGARGLGRRGGRSAPWN
ncbi:nucleolin-like [Triplophysa dalaica]|uniref:nucleolin-like n=1 Tax=Triplophysa dalaica TaxID=1582913 RepID=UPI0024DF8BE3|nr:nucleolin-like [Triplophysa dalaica]